MISKKALDENKLEIIHWCKEIKLNSETERYECEIKKLFERQMEYERSLQGNKRHIFRVPNCPEHCKREENGTSICFTVRVK